MMVALNAKTGEVALNAKLERDNGSELQNREMMIGKYAPMWHADPNLKSAGRV